MKEHFPYKPYVDRKTARDKSFLSLQRVQEIQGTVRSDAPTDTCPPVFPTHHLVTKEDIKRILHNIFGTVEKNGKK